MLNEDTKTVYAVWTNTDLTEGRGREYIKYFCELEATARRLATGSYVQGTNARVTQIQLIKNGDKFGQWLGPVVIEMPSKADSAEEKAIVEQRLAAQRREAAINRAKELGLTDDEIKALRG